MFTDLTALFAIVPSLFFPNRGCTHSMLPWKWPKAGFTFFSASCKLAVCSHLCFWWTVKAWYSFFIYFKRNLTACPTSVITGNLTAPTWASVTKMFFLFSTQTPIGWENKTRVPSLLPSGPKPAMTWTFPLVPYLQRLSPPGLQMGLCLVHRCMKECCLTGELTVLVFLSQSLSSLCCAKEKVPRLKCTYLKHSSMACVSLRP